MCLEGIQIYIMLVEVFEVEKSRVGWFYAAGYGMRRITGVA
jgi:latrophilin 1